MNIPSLGSYFFYVAPQRVPNALEKIFILAMKMQMGEMNPNQNNRWYIKLNIEVISSSVQVHSLGIEEIKTNFEYEIFVLLGFKQKNIKSSTT